MKKRKSGKQRTSPDKRQLVIEALLAGKSQKEAAALAAVSDRCVRRWLRDPAFSRKLEAARAAAFAEALGVLKGGAAEAAKTLLLNLSVKSPAERRQAAREILTFAFKGVEVLDIEARLERIEKLLSGARPGLGYVVNDDFLPKS